MLYQRLPKLLADLARDRGDGRHSRIMRTLTGTQLLILDDWGLNPLDAGARRDLYEILKERHARRSTILTSQVPVDQWHQVIGNPTYANAILDRLSQRPRHNAPATTPPQRSCRRQPARHSARTSHKGLTRSSLLARKRQPARTPQARHIISE
jgi:DNA replication protein DnaC